MNNEGPAETTALNNNSKVLVIGCGPAGSFFAIHLLGQAKHAGKSILVTLIDNRAARDPDTGEWQLNGCNFCAGIISPRLYTALEKNNLKLPPDVVCTRFSHIWIHGLWKNFPLKVPSSEKMCSVFRGTLPLDRADRKMGLDTFLLRKAVAQGAAVTTGSVETIHYTVDRRPVLTVSTPCGKRTAIESDFVCIATGMNAPAKKSSRFFASYQRLNPVFRPPQVRPTLVFELHPGQDYLKKYIHKELYLIVSGSKALHLDHIVLVPKKAHLTVALCGESIDTASLPEDAGKLIHQFLNLPHIQAILPHLSRDHPPVTCSCCPNMAISPSRSPFEDRISMVGDSIGARLYRDGLYSAFISAQSLARTVIHTGVDKHSLAQENNWVVQWLKADSRQGKMIFTLLQKALKSNIFSRILYQTFATEMKFKKMTQWPMGNVLWKIGSGGTDYEKIVQTLLRTAVLRSVLTGGFKTLRNVLTEFFFGLKWETYGRYPTVILREKRNYFKQSISGPLGVKLDAAPDMERMYSIKIRASARTIFKELGKFGQADARFLKLRFVEVQHTSGRPNQKGSIVNYRLRGLPVSMDVCLDQCIPDKALLYIPQDVFFNDGKLLFDVSPTKDGNNRLVIYTAFDFKRGRGIFQAIFWTLFRHLFPDYAHDVVWNHAICSIKALAEQATDQSIKNRV